MQKEVSQTNLQIRDLLQAKKTIKLLDPKKVDIEKETFYPIIQNCTGPIMSDDDLPHGRTGNIANGDMFAYINIHVPTGYSTVHFDMYNHAIIGSVSVAMYYAGIPYGNSSFTLFGWWGHCDVSVPMSGENYDTTVFISGGGTYTYSFKR